MKLDKTDLAILGILQLRGRIPNTQLASEIGMSPGATLERIRKLEAAGFIESFRAVVNVEKFGFMVSVWIEVKLNYHSAFKIESVMEEISRIPEIVEAYQITGSGDFLIKILVPTIRDYQRFITDKLSKLEGIAIIESKVVLKEFKKEAVPPISEDFLKVQGVIS